MYREVLSIITAAQTERKYHFGSNYLQLSLLPLEPLTIRDFIKNPIFANKIIPIIKNIATLTFEA